MLQSPVSRQTQELHAVTDIPKANSLCTSLQLLFISPIQPWYLPLCLTGPDFLSLQPLVHHLVGGRPRLFGMLVVMPVLSWPAEGLGQPLQSRSGASPNATNLLLVVQTLIVVLQHRHTFPLARVVLGIGVNDVTGQDLLPEGKAARHTYGTNMLAICSKGVSSRIGVHMQRIEYTAVESVA